MTLERWNKIDEAERATIAPFLESAPVKIAAMARALGVEVMAATLRPRISGEIKRSGTSPSGYVIRVNRHEVKTRQRFTIAHELAHFLVHRPLIGDGIEDSILYRSALSDTVEAQANRLAADLIMPEPLVRKEFLRLEILDKRQAADKMARIFEVSSSAMRVRLGLPPE